VSWGVQYPLSRVTGKFQAPVSLGAALEDKHLRGKRSKLGYVNIGLAGKHPIATPDPPMVQGHLKRMFVRSRRIDSGE
jgi:hypothetical protein